MSDPPSGAPREASGADPGQHDAFISYARRPTDQRFVDELCGELEARGKRVWIDRSDIPPAADWLARIAKGIEGSSSLIFVLSPHSAASPVCQQELSIALEQNKRVIPVLHEAVDASALPPALARLNWISFTADDDRHAAIGSVLEAIDTDLGWRDAHTRLTVRVNEWLESGRDGSFLLRGRDLRSAEEWYAGREGHRESPTPGQVDYILASRHAVSRRQRLTLAAVSVALAVAVVLAIFALVQRSNAQHQARLALSGEFAAEASQSAGSDVRLESLLSLEAFARSPTDAARSALIGAAEQPLIATMPGVDGREVEAVAYSPNDRIIAAGAGKGVGIELWNVRTHTRIGKPFDTAWQVNGIAFSSNGQLLAVADATKDSSEGAVAVYRIGNPTPIYRLSLPADAGGATAVAFSSSNNEVAVGTFGGAVLLWNPTARTYISAGLAQSSALAVTFNRHGTELAAAFATPTQRGETGAVAVYRVGSSLVKLRQYRSPDPDSNSDFDTVAFAPDGVLAAASDDGDVERFDPSRSTTKPITTISTEKAVGAVVFNPAGTLLATGDYSGAVELWDPTTGAQIGQAMEDGSVVHAVAFAPNGRSLCSAGADGALFVWDASGLTPRARTIPAGDEISEVALDRTGRELVTIGYLSGVATAWDGTGGRRIGRRTPTSATSIATAPDSELPATAAAVNRHGDKVALGLVNGDVLLENATLTTLRRLLPESDSPAGTPSDELPVVTMAFSADGRFLAVGHASGQLSLWTLDPLKLVANYQFVSPQALNPGIQALAFNPAGTALAVSTAINTHVIDPTHPQKTPPTLTSAETLFSLAYTPDGATLVAGDGVGNIELFDAAGPPRTGAGSIYPAPRTLQGDGSVIYAVAVSADGQTLASGDSSGILRLWDLSTEQPLGVAVNVDSPLFDAAFLANDQLVTGAMDGDIVVWPSLLLSHTLAAFSQDLCPRLSRNLTAAQWQQYAAGQPYHATCPGAG